MAEDWLADVRKYAANADDKVVGAIVKYLGVALRNRDSSLVSFSDPEEVGRVRERWLRKKLGLTDTDAVLNEGLDWVKGVMSGDHTKNRVTVYYLLAHYFGKLDLFGGPAGTSAASLGGAAAGIGAAGMAGAAREPEPLRASEPGSMASPPSETSPPPSYAANVNESGAGGSGWPSWLTWLLAALAVIALFFLLRSCMAERQATTTDAVTANAATGEAVAVPAGAGVVSGVKDNKPMLTVYFGTGKSEVSNDMAAASGALKAY